MSDSGRGAYVLLGRDARPEGCHSIQPDLARPTLVVSFDEGESWRPEIES